MGLAAVVGTPSASPPKWLVDSMPDMISLDKMGSQGVRFAAPLLFFASGISGKMPANRNAASQERWVITRQYSRGKSTTSMAVMTQQFRSLPQPDRDFDSGFESICGHRRALNQAWPTCSGAWNIETSMRSSCQAHADGPQSRTRLGFSALQLRHGS